MKAWNGWCSAARWAVVALAMVWSGLAAARGPLFLWEVLDAAGTVRAYLYGTIHVCDAACFPLPARVTEAFARSDSLALELDPEDPALAGVLARAGVLPEDQRLDDRLPAALRPRLTAAARLLGIPPAVLQRLQPWMASTVLTLRAAAQAGFVTEQGIDLWLARAAQARGLPLRPLETVERQLAALSAGGDAAQAAGVEEVVDLVENEAGREFFGALVQAWRAGDVGELDHLMREVTSSPAMAPLLEDMLDARNREMAETLVGRLTPGARPFVAVGAGHFGQDSGLLAQLARRGFRLRQVEAD